MKILVVSDTHGSIGNVIEHMEKDRSYNMVIHLGDNTEDGKVISDLTGIETLIVKGNCDYGDDTSLEEILIELEGVKLFATHGHIYGVKRDITNIFYRGKELEADIVVFGHTHISLSIEYEGLHVFNPGSASEPRLGMKPSVGVLELKDEVVEKKIIEL